MSESNREQGATEEPCTPERRLRRIECSTVHQHHCSVVDTSLYSTVDSRINKQTRRCRVRARNPVGQEALQKDLP